jgi:nuclear transport factor 2 (NTF2) superfamily protein
MNAIAARPPLPPFTLETAIQKSWPILKKMTCGVAERVSQHPLSSE